MTALKSLFFFLFVPGMLIGVFPWWVAQSDIQQIDMGVLRFLAVPLWLISAGMMVWCFWDFTTRGRGTPAPIDPPKELVVSGLYRYVRNPMYVAGLIGLIGWVLWSPSWAMILAPLLFFGATHMFILLYEEPTLKKKFGASYEEFIHKVPRWIPRKPK